MTYDNYKDFAVDLQLENDELRAKVSRLNCNVLDLQREVRELLARNRYCEGKLRKSGNSAEPVLDKWDDEGVDECHCEDCGTELPWREWTFCPMCGKWLDWDFAHPTEPDWDLLRDAALDR